ncbi:hypothetical protein ACCS61_32375 [Rhizobium ruizarguesonis]
MSDIDHATLEGIADLVLEVLYSNNHVRMIVNDALPWTADQALRPWMVRRRDHNDSHEFSRARATQNGLLMNGCLATDASVDGHHF